MGTTLACSSSSSSHHRHSSSTHPPLQHLTTSSRSSAWPRVAALGVGVPASAVGVQMSLAVVHNHHRQQHQGAGPACGQAAVAAMATHSKALLGSTAIVLLVAEVPGGSHHRQQQQQQQGLGPGVASQHPQPRGHGLTADQAAASPLPRSACSTHSSRWACSSSSSRCCRCSAGAWGAGRRTWGPPSQGSTSARVQGQGRLGFTDLGRLVNRAGVQRARLAAGVGFRGWGQMAGGALGVQGGWGVLLAGTGAA
jgi:hypothetical protein